MIHGPDVISRRHPEWRGLTDRELRIEVDRLLLERRRTRFHTGLSRGIALTGKGAIFVDGRKLEEGN